MAKNTPLRTTDPVLSQWSEAINTRLRELEATRTNAVTIKKLSGGSGGSGSGGTGDVTGPASSVSGDFAQYADTTGKVLEDTGLAPTTDGTLSADSDSLIPSEKAVKTYADTKVAGAGTVVDSDIVLFNGTSGTSIKDSGVALTSFRNGACYLNIDGSGSVPSTGFKAYLRVPYACTLVDWMLLANLSGNCSIDVRKSTYSGFPTTTSIVASAPPTLTSQQKNTSTSLTGWTTSISEDDILEFDLSSVSTCTWLQLSLKVHKY